MSQNDERAALEKIAAAGVSESYPGHHNNARHLRCNSCGHRWADQVEPEHHSDDCAAVIARAALANQRAEVPLRLPPLACRHSNRSDCALFGVSTNRPSRAPHTAQQGEQENGNG